jgi:hypothetical protein
VVRLTGPALVEKFKPSSKMNLEHMDAKMDTAYLQSSSLETKTTSGFDYLLASSQRAETCTTSFCDHCSTYDKFTNREFILNQDSR